MKIENLRVSSQRLTDLTLRPNAKRAEVLLQQIVGSDGCLYEPGIKAATQSGHLAPDVLENIARHSFEQRFARNLERG